MNIYNKQEEKKIYSNIDDLENKTSESTSDKNIRISEIKSKFLKAFKFFERSDWLLGDNKFDYTDKYFLTELSILSLGGAGQINNSEEKLIRELVKNGDLLHEFEEPVFSIYKHYVINTECKDCI